MSDLPEYISPEEQAGIEDAFLQRCGAPGKAFTDAKTVSLAFQKAADMVASGEYRSFEICKEVGIGRVTLFNWEQRSDFRQMVEESTAELRRRAMEFGYAKKSNRLALLQKTLETINSDIESRAKYCQEQEEFPEYTHSGLWGYKIQNTSFEGKSGTVERQKVEFFYDHALDQARRKLLDQMAREMGDIHDKSEVLVLVTQASESFERRMAATAAKLGATRLLGEPDYGGQGAP